MTTTGRRCAHIDCRYPAIKRGLCRGHYRYLYRKGELIARSRPPRYQSHALRAPARPRQETPTVTQPKPDPLAWVDNERLQAALDDPTTPDRRWLDGAPCLRSTVDMFPSAIVGVSKAKAVCATCDPDCVYHCLAYALMAAGKSDDFGVYGNTSQRERSKIRGRVNVTVRAKIHDRGLRV